MIVAVGQLTGQNPAYRPADRPNRVLFIPRTGILRRGFVVLRLFAIPIMQVLLVGVVIASVAMPSGGYQGTTLLAWKPGTPNPNYVDDATDYGFPIRWLRVNHFTNEAQGIDQLRVTFSNPLMPIFAVAVAICAPLLLRRSVDQRTWYVVIGAGVGLLPDALLLRQIVADDRVSFSIGRWILELGVFRTSVSVGVSGLGLLVVRLLVPPNQPMRPPHGADGASGPSA